ncbi:MAG: hypothetical protein ACE5Q6_16170, partial [Dehalococcoidia bacterium]
MTQHYAVPGVYIEEQTGPGVIAGVSTSISAFVGPALRGPINEARRVTSYDEFLEHYAITRSDGTRWPFITDSRPFYLAHAVRGFFTNGGRLAYIVRVGTGLAKEWTVDNQAGEPVFRLQARDEGVGGNDIIVQVQTASATDPPVAAATGSATVANDNGVNVTVDNAAPFRVGDTVTQEPPAGSATITEINGNVLTLSATITGLNVNDTLRIANILPEQNGFRLEITTGLWPGSVVLISGDDADNPGNAVTDYAVVESIDRTTGFVTLAPSPARSHPYNLDSGAASPTTLTSQEFRLIITPPPPSGEPAETFADLSLSPVHPNYVFSAVESDWVRVLAPDVPPIAGNFPQRLVNAMGNVVDGQNDNPADLTSAHYAAGLNVLRDIDDVNILCIPDSAAHPERIIIQKAMIEHCLLPGLQDRFAI